MGKGKILGGMEETSEQVQTGITHSKPPINLPNVVLSRYTAQAHPYPGCRKCRFSCARPHASLASVSDFLISTYQGKRGVPKRHTTFARSHVQRFV